MRRQAPAFFTGLAFCLCAPALVCAQPSSSAPNQGALTITAGVDLPSIYFFRGIRQEGDPKVTVSPWGALTGVIRSGDGLRLAIEIGMWDSLHTGTSGSGGPERKLQYEEDFSAGATADLRGGIRVRSRFVAYTSPNRSFTTIKEADVEVGQRGRFAPYALAAFELSDNGQRDNGFKRGTYLEVGGRPRWSLPLRGVTVTVPVRAGFSLKDYYELFGSDLAFHDSRFGFFEIGGLAAMPLTREASRFGRWSVHAGADVLRLGTTAKGLNHDDATALVALAGIDLAY